MFDLIFIFVPRPPPASVEHLEAGVVLTGRVKRHSSFSSPLHQVNHPHSSASRIITTNAATRIAMKYVSG